MDLRAERGKGAPRLGAMQELSGLLDLNSLAQVLIPK